MKLPLNWLKDYITLPTDPKILIDKMTSIGHMQDGPAKQIAGDVVYDLEIRQNRSDCLSILGLAREAGAVLNEIVKYPESLNGNLPEKLENTFVDIQNPELCYRLQTLKIENITIAPSPDWIVKVLEAYGMKSINNVVDITNFVMIELGEPMHAYDTRQIKDKMIVRLANTGEKTVVLGEKQVELTDQDLVIADTEKILSIAGIIGGEHTSVQPDTTSIILEDATYNQATIRRTSIRHSIRTEASTRHEKFLHPHLSTLALKRAAELLAKYAGGRVVEYMDSYPTKHQDVTIDLDISHLNALGGIDLSLEEVLAILKKLDIEVLPKSEDCITIQVPYFRTDLQQEADIIEEVLRIYGYDNIVATLPHSPPPLDIQSKSTYALEEQIRDLMVASGYDEQITEPLTKEESSALIPVVLQNSLNSDKTMLRTTMKPSLVAALENQKKYRKEDIRLFEVGKIYYKDGKEYKEDKMIAGISEYKNNSYSDAKGVLEVLFDRLHREWDEKIITIEALNKNTFYFQVKLQDLIDAPIVSYKSKVLTSPPQLILQDISVAAPLETRIGDVIASVKKSSGMLYKVSLGEEPQTLKNDQKSIFLKLSFYSSEKIITGQDVEMEKKKILDLLIKEYNVTLR